MVSFAPSTVKHIARDKKVIGFKDSSANGAYLQAVIYEMRDREDFSIFVGPEEMTAEAVLLGAAGGVNGGANMFPELYVSLYEAAKTNNLKRVRELQQIVMQISVGVYTQGQYGSSYLKGVKCALNVLGVCNDHLASPFNKFGNEQKAKIKELLDDIDTSVFA
jgi:4-hydroxy-tetrahydrodipicolinate synthase